MTASLVAAFKSAVLLACLICLSSTDAFAGPAAAGEDEAWAELSKAQKAFEAKGPAALTPEGLEAFYKKLCPAAGELADRFEVFQKQFPASAHADEAWGTWMDLLNAAAYRLPERRAQLERIEREFLADPKLDANRRQTIHSNQLDRTADVAARERLLRTLEPAYAKEPWFYCQQLLTVARLSDHPHSLEVVEEVLKRMKDNRGSILDDAVTMKAMLERIGRPLELKFTAFDGRTIDLKDYRGKVVLLDFWATWCPPCVAGLAKVEAAREKLAAEGFEVIGLSNDTERETLARFVKKRGLTWPQFFDAAGDEAPLIKSLGHPGPPSYWLIDRQGLLVDVNAGIELEQKAKRLLAGGTGQGPAAPAK